MNIQIVRPPSLVSLAVEAAKTKSEDEKFQSEGSAEPTKVVGMTPGTAAAIQAAIAAAVTANLTKGTGPR